MIDLMNEILTELDCMLAMCGIVMMLELIAFINIVIIWMKMREDDES